MTHSQCECLACEIKRRSITDEQDAPSMEDPASELNWWWVEQAKAEANAVAPKAVEYSAYDLELIGRIMADTIGWKGEQTRAVHTELGCWFYTIGKMGRAVGAMREGRLPSDDTIHDLNVYGRMISRTRDVGGWPN